MIRKIATFKDMEIDRQVEEIVRNQFDKKKEVTVTFPDSTTEVKVDVGFNADRFIVVDKNANIIVYRTKSDSRYMYLKSSGAGTVTLKVWKGGM